MNLLLIPLLAVLADAPAPNAPVAAVQIPESEAIERFDLRKRLDTYGAGARVAEAAIRVGVVDGDLHVAGDLLLDYADDRKGLDALRARAAGDRSAVGPHANGLIVTGNLVVDGAIINSNLNYGPFLLVLGETRARAIYGAGAELRFERRARVSDAVVGVYNDGSIRFAGGVEARLLISEDHMIDVRGEPAPDVYDYFNGDDDLERLRALLHPAIAVGDPEEDEPLDAERALLPRVRRGEPVAR